MTHSLLTRLSPSRRSVLKSAALGSVAAIAAPYVKPSYAAPTVYFRDFVASSANLPKPDPLRRAQNQLNPGDMLFSATKAFQLTFQTDGNLVLYGLDDTSLSGALVPPPPQLIPNAAYTKVIWASATNATGGPVRCNMQTDGNLVLYDQNGGAVWASGTSGHPGVFLRCRDDGDLVMLAPNGAVIASSNTYAGSR